MSRSPIQVPNEIKEEVDNLKSRLFVKTHYEVIEKLIKYYYDNEEEKQRRYEEQQRDHEIRQATTVYLGGELKEKYREQMEYLKLKDEASLFSFLLEHYLNSRTIDRLTLDHYIELR